MKIKKVLVLGSGALKIGEAGEFDYSGSQAIKALKEEGIQTVLVNPNIATIQTSEHLADKIYFLPVTDYFVSKVIAKEKPDGIFLSFGGQTALNCGIALYKKGVLNKYGVKILGSPIDAIILSEDREKFANHLRALDIFTPQSRAAETINDAKQIANKLGYPLMVRAAYALGGQKSGVVRNEHELEEKAEDAFSFSPQILVEKYLHHYKEVEYEVVRDQYDNCITVCNMENMDPLGIHTGESVVVAPSQTLTNFEYHQLRKTAMKIVRSLKIVGECNVQFALNPKPNDGNRMEYYVIELNARLSRSSALASKATGYPLAYVAAKLALGKSLTEIKNQVTQVTQSCFEPALDYIVTKIPRWDLEKFSNVEYKIGSSMKSVGEVMGIGRTFEESFQKAIRMLNMNTEGVTDMDFPKAEKDFMNFLKIPTPKRMFALAEGIKRGITVAELYKLTGIDCWFLDRIKHIVETEKKYKTVPFTSNSLLALKQAGFSDKQIGSWTDKTGLDIRKRRQKLGVKPYVFQIDTLAGEFPAKTNYLYMTYHGFHHDVKPLGSKGVIVLGSGPYHIGSSVEFDWTCVNTVMRLKKHARQSIVINCNPETVSTDYDISDRLYFEELTFERVADIYEYEHSQGVIVSVGGQRPNNLAYSLSRYGFKLLGTQAVDIDRAEDRSKFSQLLDKLQIPQPAWNKFSNPKRALEFAERVGYPVLIRPSYVLSGTAMTVCYTPQDLEYFVKQARKVGGHEISITVSKFMEEAKEIEMDAIAQQGKILVSAIAEHIEHAGVHSGDATIVYPPQKIYILTEKKINEITRRLAQALHITGPFNIQFLAKGNTVYVIEVNLRASRTLPFISKATKVNFANVLGDALFHKGKAVPFEYPDYTVVKAPQFSFARLEGADPVLRVEMSSTGEVACFGDDVDEALLKSTYATGTIIDQKNVLLSIGGIVNKKKFLESARLLQTMGFKIYATEKTSIFLQQNSIDSIHVYKQFEHKNPHVLDLIRQKKVSLVINISEVEEGESNPLSRQLTDGYAIRRATIDHNIALFTDIRKATAFIKAMSVYRMDDLQIKSWDEYK